MITTNRNLPRIGSAAAVVLALAALVTMTGQASANAKEDCINSGGIWRAVGGDLSSWTCYKSPKKRKLGEPVSPATKK